MTDPKLQDSSGGHAGANAQRTTEHNRPQGVVGCQSRDAFGSAEKPARFAVGYNGASAFIFQDDGFPSLRSLGCLNDLGQAHAKSVCALLNELDAERRGDSPVDVQRQLLEELRELVKLQRTSLTKMTSVVEDQLALQREAMGKSAQGETKRPEPNVNDLMYEVARGFGLSDATSRSIGDLKGFCAAAMEMASVPEAAKEPLLRLAVRGVFGDVKALGAKVVMESMGLDLG